MKRWVMTLLLAASFVLLLCAAVSAVDVATGGISIPDDSTGMVPYAGNTPAEKSADGTYYVNADKIRVTYTTVTEGNFYLVVAQSGIEAPNQDNIVYIDQKTAETGETQIVFDVYPSTLKSTSEYHIYIFSNDGSAKAEIGTFTYHVNFKKGDVNGSNTDNEPNIDDALEILRYIVHLPVANEDLLLALGNLDGKGTVPDIDDALIILKFIVKLIPEIP